MTVENHEAKHRFEVNAEGHTAFLNYRKRAEGIEMVHTEVPPELEGRGLGGKLARAALDYARAEHLKVTASCPFVAEYIRRHPEYADLLESA